MKKLQFIIFILSILIHLSFYVSSYFTHTFNIFFEHVTMGQDFFSVPNAAYSFLHGGTLTGELPIGIASYINCCGVNSNVYHPLFTLLIGLPLQLFQPWTAFGIWGALHLVASIVIVTFLWKKFRHHKYLYFALSFYLLNSYHYYEIQHAQYHFLVSLFTVFFLYEAEIKGDTRLAGVWYFLGLLIKPLGLLWIFPLVIYKRFQTSLIGLGIYILVSIPFLILPIGNYFFNNLFYRVDHQASTYNLFALTEFFPIQAEIIKYLAISLALLLLIFQFVVKPKFFSIIFLWISFQLIFYSLIFHYHYSILASLICLGILLNVIELKNPLALLSSVMLTIPTPIIFFHLSGDPDILPTQHLSMVALWSIFWLTMLCAYIITSSFRKSSLKV